MSTPQAPNTAHTTCYECDANCPFEVTLDTQGQAIAVNGPDCPRGQTPAPSRIFRYIWEPMKPWIAFAVCQLCAVLAFAQMPPDTTVYSLNGDLTELLGKTHGTRTPILTPFYEWGIRRLDSVTVYNRLHRLDSLAEAHNDRDLALEVDLMDIHYYAYRSYFPSEVPINMLVELNKVATEEGVPWLEIRCQSLLGNYYFNGLRVRAGQRLL